MIELLLFALGTAYVKARADRDPDNIVEAYQNGKISRETAIKKIAALGGDEEEFEGLQVPKLYKDLLEQGYTANNIEKELGNLPPEQKKRLMANLEQYEEYGNYDYRKAAENKKSEASVTLQGDPEAIKRILGK